MPLEVMSAYPMRPTSSTGFHTREGGGAQTPVSYLSRKPTDGLTNDEYTYMQTNIFVLRVFSFVNTAP